MARVELVMPKMGESIMEATILKWRKKPSDRIELDEPVLDIATDKVDSEIPSPVAGVLVEILFQENDVVPINKTIAVIETETANAQPAAHFGTRAGRNAVGFSLRRILRTALYGGFWLATIPLFQRSVQRKRNRDAPASVRMGFCRFGHINLAQPRIHFPGARHLQRLPCGDRRPGLRSRNLPRCGDIRRPDPLHS